VHSRITLVVIAIVVVFAALTAAPKADAHRPGAHTGPDLYAPLYHWLVYARQTTNHELAERCRPRPDRAVTPAAAVPQFARRFTIRIELLRLELARTMSSRCVPWYITAQIRAANHLAATSLGDPWPNCPDPGPRDNQGPGHSWTDTVACENGGSWLDSPGFYRCGLQFHPMWERVYGRLCP
jgi:hypothetical protein